MNRYPQNGTIRVVTLAMVVCLFPVLLRADDNSGRFLLVSDIHFDPFYDGTLFERLAREPAEKWADILATSQPSGFNSPGTDSNYALLKSSLDAVRRTIPEPDFILYPGDFMAHGWQSRYDALAKQSHLDNPRAYREFTTKAIRFLAGQFHKRYPHTPVLPTLGNDDSYCGDYMIEPEGSFLEMFAAEWTALLGPQVDRQVFGKTFRAGGFYTLPLPGMKRHRLIVLNSVFFSIKYNNACGKSAQTPALDQLRWFARTLSRAQAAGQQVWLLMHIPPGLNSYSSSSNVQKGRAAVTFWQPTTTSRFLQLVKQYRTTIQTAFAGHTHMDDFRVIRLDGEPTLLSKIAPAISPIFGNNPGYQIFQHDRQEGVLRNYQTHYLTNLSADGRPTLGIAGRWALEYDFRKAYGLARLSARTVASLARSIGTDPATVANYTKFYSVSSDPAFDSETIDVYRCAVPSVTPAEFQTCYSGVPKPRAPPPLAGRKAAVADK